MTKTLLIIEDDRDTSEMLGYLAELLHLNVIVSRILLSISDIQTLDPQLILMDHRLRDGFGGDLCRCLKENQGTHHIPIVILSASKDIAKVAKACKADHFMAKPFELDELQQCILERI